MTESNKKNEKLMISQNVKLKSSFFSQTALMTVLVYIVVLSKKCETSGFSYVDSLFLFFSSYSPRIKILFT